MTVRITRFAVLYLFLFAAILAKPSFAQDSTGSIVGTVRDVSGAAIPKATVLLLNTDRNQTVRTLQTGDGGVYSATELPLGSYTINVSAAGFGEQRLTDIVLHVNDALTINADLKPGRASETVVVTASAQQINLEDATQAGLINASQVTELVLSGRNFSQLVALQPGVAYAGSDTLYIGNTNPSGGTNTVQFSVNGSRNTGNNYTVDGADNVDRGSNATLLTYPSVDAIAEFKTLRNQYSAEFGRSANGQINVVTKSGTAKIHGSLYEFVRNDIFNANAVLNKLNTTPNGAVKATANRFPLRYNDFGGTIGGPIVIPRIYDGRVHKSFFFFSDEERRVIASTPFTLSGIPDANMRQGIFPSTVCTSINTTNGACNAGATGTVINPSAFSNSAKAYLQDIYSKVPLPAADGTLAIQQRGIFNQDQQLFRVDQALGERLQVFFRGVKDRYPTVEPAGLFSGATSGLPGVNTTTTTSHGTQYLGHITFVPSPRMVVVAGYAYSANDIIADPTGLLSKAKSPNVAAAVNLPFVSTLSRVPGLSFTGGTALTTYGPYRNYGHDHNPFLNITFTAGRQTLHVGATFYHYGKIENAASGNAGSFTFNNAGQPTAAVAPNTQAYQQSFANFLTGFATSFTQANIDINPNIQVNQFETYFQDDWKATSRLTLNLGIRYSKFGQPTDANHLLTTFDPLLYNAANAPTVDKSNNGDLCVPGAACTGGVIPNPTASLINGISINRSDATLGNSPYGNQIGKSDNLDFAPRFGFALDVFGTGKTSLRGGFGIAFDSSLFSVFQNNVQANRPYLINPVFSNVTFDNPAPSNRTPALVARATAPNYRNPYNEQFSLAVQQILAGGVNLEIAYVGNHQVHLLGLVDINQAAPGAFVTAGLAAAITSSNVGLINQIRPYRGYSAINSIQPIFVGNYNSLQIATKKQFRGKSLIAANYTWSRALTTANADRAGAPQVSSLPSAEYGRAAADRTHIFNMNAIYALPFFENQRGLTGHVLGGWELSGILFANSGLPLNVTTSTLDPAGIGVSNGSSVSAGRPDRIGDPNTATTQGSLSLANGIHNRRRWFNPNAFAPVPVGQYRAGNAGRNIINGPGWSRADVGLFRNFRFTEGLNLQLRGEAQNILNHTNPDGISTGGIISSFTPLSDAVSGSTAGNVTSYRDKRILQLGAKLLF